MHYLFIYCACVCACVCHGICMEIYHVNARDETHVIRLGDSRLYLLSHLAHPGLSFKVTFQLNSVSLAFLFFRSVEVGFLMLIFPVTVSTN